jgi:hypothetical protein
MATTLLDEKRSLLDTAYRCGSIKSATYNDCLRKIARLSLSDCREIAKPATHALSHASLPAPGGQGERQQLAMMPGSALVDELSMHSRLIGAMQRVKTYMGRRTAVNDKSRAMEVSQALTMACSAMDMLCDELGRSPVNLGLSSSARVELTACEAQALAAANTVGGLSITAGQLAAARGRAPVVNSAPAKVLELSASAPGELTAAEMSALRAAQSVGLRTTAADMIAARSMKRFH